MESSRAFPVSSAKSATSKLHAPAILFGWLADVALSGIAGVAVVVAFGVDPMDAAAVDGLSSVLPYFLVSLPVALVCTAIGGYVAGHLAAGEELNNAFVMGVASAVTSLVFTIGATVPLWYLAASIALTVPAALGGGYVRARTRA